MLTHQYKDFCKCILIDRKIQLKIDLININHDLKSEMSRLKREKLNQTKQDIENRIDIIEKELKNLED